jgi:hypothetical protein
LGCGGFWAKMMVPGAGAAGTLSEARNHCAMASVDTMATVSKALFRDVSICRTLGKFPSWALRRHSIGARDESHGHATSYILRPDFDVWSNIGINVPGPIDPAVGPV